MGISKKLIKLLLVIIMIALVISSFLLIILGHYTSGIIVGGIFMFLANFVNWWFSDKNEEYVYSNIYEHNRDRWNK